jgi:hypothetical protein
MRERSVLKVLVALFAVASLAFIVPTVANHTQTDTGKSIVFDEKPGNDYWVEVGVTGAAAAQVTKVEASFGAPNAQGWNNLPKQSWGTYAASFFAPNGGDVRFRATFSDGTMAVSCWFKHPAGTEECSYPAPPGNWRSSSVGDVGTTYGGESVVADVDFDNVGELLVATDNGVYMFDKTTTGWVRSTVLLAEPDTPSASVQDFDQIAVATTDNDQVMEVYTAGRYYNGQYIYDRLMWHHFTGEQWYHETVWDFVGISDLVIGDIDDDGKDELMVLTTNSQGSIAYRVHKSAGDFWFTEIARLPYDQTMARGAVADADRDLDKELYIHYGIYPYDDAILRVDMKDGGYVKDTIFTGRFSGETRGFAAGDGDNDGLDELYLLDAGFFATDANTVHRFSVRTDGWNHATIPLGKGLHNDLDLADGNGDGFKELYSGTSEGQLAQLMWTGSAWSARAVYQVPSGEFITEVTTGDTDGDGKRETYGLTYDAYSNVCCETTDVVRMAPLGGSTTTTTTSMTTTSGGGFDATFTGVRGNEWWVQASVAGNQAISKVDVRLNGGAWQPVTKQSWGWGSSYHIVQGTIVQLRATSTSGATDLSSCYRWIPPSGADATVVACGGSTTTTTTSATTTTTGSAFDATFTGVKGNEWWVQANVAANQALAGVDARVNCAGTWHPLTKQGWGGWAASFNVPNGSKVDFRARSTSGASDLSGGYIWTAATPTSAC